MRKTLCRGADVNARDAYGYTALYRAAELGHLAVVRELLGRCAERDKKLMTSRGSSSAPA